MSTLSRRATLQQGSKDNVRTGGRNSGKKTKRGETTAEIHISDDQGNEQGAEHILPPKRLKLTEDSANPSSDKRIIFIN